MLLECSRLDKLGAEEGDVLILCIHFCINNHSVASMRIIYISFTSPGSFISGSRYLVRRRSQLESSQFN